MTEQEYNEQLIRVEKYHDYESIIKNLESKKMCFSDGIGKIKSINGLYESEPREEYYGDGFPKLLTDKILEAYQEQIEMIQKKMEKI